MGKSSSPPPAPDYVGAANATAAGNMAAAQATASANRVNQITPDGTLTYKESGVDSKGNPMWTSTQTRSAQQQAIADQNNALSLQYGGIAQQGINAIQPMLSNPNLDTSAMPAMPQNAGTTTQDVLMARLQPQIDRQNQMSDAQLANQGIMQGSEAYRNAKTDMSQHHNDLMLQAAGQGVNTDMAARNQYISNQSAIQNQPLNIVNALRTGSQVTAPQFTNAPQQQGVAGPDLLGAASATGQYNQGVYNAQQAANGDMMGGLFGLGSSAITAWSDRRLKRNITRIGTHALGIGLYAWEYLWGEKSIGVMADEVESVMPDAVITHPSGFKMVNYAMIGG